MRVNQKYFKTQSADMAMQSGFHMCERLTGDATRRRKLLLKAVNFFQEKCQRQTQNTNTRALWLVIEYAGMQQGKKRSSKAVNTLEEPSA